MLHDSVLILQQQPSVIKQEQPITAHQYVINGISASNNNNNNNNSYESAVTAVCSVTSGEEGVLDQTVATVIPYQQSTITHISTHSSNSNNNCTTPSSTTSSTTSSSGGGGGGGSTTRRKAYGCEICPAMFGSKMELEEHSNSHTGEKPFECDVCNARFNRRSTLWNHKRIHSDHKPFRCPICAMHFKWKNSLKCHKEMHLRKNETGPLDAEAFRIQLLSPSKRGRTARGASRKRGGSMTAATSCSMMPGIGDNGVTNGHEPEQSGAVSPDFSILEDPSGYRAEETLLLLGSGLVAADGGGVHPQQQHNQISLTTSPSHPQDRLTALLPSSTTNAHHDGSTVPMSLNSSLGSKPLSTSQLQLQQPQRGPSILQQALQQAPSPILQSSPQHHPPVAASSHHQPSYQIYVQSLPPMSSSNNGTTEDSKVTLHQQLGLKLSPPSGTTPLNCTTSRGESPIASGGSGSLPPRSQHQQQSLIHYLNDDTYHRTITGGCGNTGGISTCASQSHLSLSGPIPSTASSNMVNGGVGSNGPLPPVCYYSPSSLGLPALPSVQQATSGPPHTSIPATHISEQPLFDSYPLLLSANGTGPPPMPPSCSNGGPPGSGGSGASMDYIPNVDFMTNYSAIAAASVNQQLPTGYAPASSANQISTNGTSHHPHLILSGNERIESGYVVRELQFNEW